RRSNTRRYRACYTSALHRGGPSDATRSSATHLHPVHLDGGFVRLRRRPARRLAAAARGDSGRTDRPAGRRSRGDSGSARAPRGSRDREVAQHRHGSRHRRGRHAVGRGSREGRRCRSPGEPPARRRRLDGRDLDDDDHHRAAAHHSPDCRDQVVTAMFAVLAAVLSFAPVALDVPYVPQTDALCGGAAAAMVFRYWGDAHASVQSFAPLVDRRAGGIADDVLVKAIAERGWTAERVDGSLDALGDALRRGEPPIVLLSDRGTRYHYLVVVGRTAEAVIVHDPSWGPNRAIRDAAFDARWRASGRWMLIVRPAQVRADV